MKKRVTVAFLVIVALVLLAACDSSILKPGLGMFNKARDAYIDSRLNGSWSNIARGDTYSIEMDNFSPEHGGLTSSNFTGTIKLTATSTSATSVNWQFAAGTDVTFLHNGQSVHVYYDDSTKRLSLGSVTQTAFNNACMLIVDDVIDYRLDQYDIPDGIKSVFMTRGERSISYLRFYVEESEWNSSTNSSYTRNHYYYVTRFNYEMKYTEGDVAPTEYYEVHVRDADDNSTIEYDVDKVGTEVVINYGGGGSVMG